MNPCAIAYGIDASYVLPLAVSIRSVLGHWNSPRPLEIIVLENSVSAADKAHVEKAVGRKLQWVAASPIERLSAGLHFSSANYFRLHLPSLPLDRVLYLDADTVARADLSSLWDHFDDRVPLQACRDYLGTIANPLIRLERFDAFGFSGEEPYFNSGVLLMNLKRWREEGIAEKVISLGRASPETLFFADQTAINIALRGRIGLLPPEWNAQTVHPRVADGTWKVPFIPQALDRAKLVHYTSEWKPWGQGAELPAARFWHEARASAGL